MEDLLPYYERELGFLRRYSREFAERYPKIAGELLMAGDVCEDPHIERMIQSFALLSSRVSKRLDDDYPELTEALFEVLYPHYLRPFPSCSIARMDYSGAASQLTSVARIARGTELSTRPVKGVACKFRTAYDVVIAPIALSAARFAPILEAPESVVLPASTSSCISLTIRTTAPQAGFAQLGLDSLRLFIDGEASFCAAFRDALFMKVGAAYIEQPGDSRWRALATAPVSAAGFSEDEALLPFARRAHPAFRILTEFFAFPEKFNFFDIDMRAIGPLLAPACREFTLHLALKGLRSDSGPARILGTTSINSVLLGCTPVVNLFRQRGEPIRLTHTTAQYPVLADARRAYAYDVYSIDSVKMVRQTPQGEAVTEFRPFYSLRHGEASKECGHYWVARRDETIAARSPGHETEISIVDIDFDPAAVETDTLSLDLTSTNRDLPAMLPYGLPGGDLFLEGGSALNGINLLRKPTESFRFGRGKGAHWRLVSHLSLNHLSLTAGGLEAFRETLALYDLPASAASQRQIASVTGIEYQATKAWLPGNPFASMVRGMEVRVTIDEDGFVGSGIHAFAQVLDRFLGMYVSANGFTQLVVISKKTGEELLRCLPRSGDLTLV